jgi:uncharacterized protein YdaU (DUF1376 family)
MKAPAFQLYAQDFDMDTATWENDEVGAYLRLLLYEWVNGGLPSDTYKLSKIVRESEKKFVGKWKNLSTKFIQNGNGLLINKRMEEVRQKQSQYLESQREKGIKSAKKRWEGHITPVTTTVKERLQPNDNSSSSTSSSSSNNKKKNILTDEAFLLSLKEKFTWIDFDSAMVRMDAWLLAHPGRKKTRKFIVNWLNRIDKPMEVQDGKEANELLERIRNAKKQQSPTW